MLPLEGTDKLLEKNRSEKIEEIYLVLSDLRYLLHKESNSLEDYQKICLDYCKRIATAARYAGEMLPDERLSELDED